MRLCIRRSPDFRLFSPGNLLSLVTTNLVDFYRPSEEVSAIIHERSLKELKVGMIA